MDYGLSVGFLNYKKAHGGIGLISLFELIRISAMGFCF